MLFLKFFCILYLLLFFFENCLKSLNIIHLMYTIHMLNFRSMRAEGLYKTFKTLLKYFVYIHKKQHYFKIQYKNYFASFWNS